jgi:DNA-binding GntR family transcriptional regulator
LRYEISNRAGGQYTGVTDVLKPVAPIARESVEDRVAEALRNLIVTGQLPEGTPLVQRDLAERLGVSQTPVRLGLVELERVGLVDIGENGRASVSRLTREDFEEISAARLGLEGLAARVGAAAVGPDELERMRRGLRELERLGREADVDGYLRARWAFHAACYEASGRTRLLAEVERLFWRSERYNRLVLSSKERFRHSVGNYRRFYDACKAGDPKAAERVIHESMQWAVDLIWDELPSESE